MTNQHKLDLGSRKFFANPYPVYDCLLQRGAVFIGDTWLVARYADSVSVFKDIRLSKKLPETNPPSPLARSIAFLDPPEHTRVRGVLQEAFTPTAIRQLENRMELVADQMIKKLKANRTFDYHHQFATQYPIRIIAEMLEVPEIYIPELQRRANRYTQATDISRFQGLSARKQIRAIRSLQDYFREIIGIRCRTPSNGVLSKMISSMQEGRINEMELLDACALLLVAGSDTTTNLLGTGVLSLIRFPEQFDRLKNDSGLMTSSIEEMLRFESPLQRGVYRVTTEPIEIAGVVIPAGEKVSPVLGAANRDPDEFTNPHCFDISRPQNRHIAFGFGIHACIGASLARSEARHAFNRIIEHFPGIRLAIPEESIRWRRNITMRGVTALPIRW